MKRIKIILLVFVMLTVGLMTACELKEQPPEAPNVTQEEIEPAVTAEKLIVDNGEWICMDGESVHIVKLNGDLKFTWFTASIQDYSDGNGVTNSGVYTIDENELKIIILHDEEKIEESYIATVEGESINLQGADSETVSFAGVYKKKPDTPESPDPEEQEPAEQEPVEEDPDSEYVINENIFSDLGLTFNEILNKRGVQTWEGVGTSANGFAYTFENGYCEYLFGEDSAFPAKGTDKCKLLSAIPAANIFEGLGFVDIMEVSDIAEWYPVTLKRTGFNEHDNVYYSEFIYKDYTILVQNTDATSIQKFSYTNISKS